MKPIDESSRQFVNNMVESAIRIGLIFILVWGTFHIIKPFILPVLWGAIIAVALNPLVNMLSARINGKRTVAATIVTVLSILLLISPFAMISTSIYDGLIFLTEVVKSGQLAHWAPNPAIKEWPLVGQHIFDGLAYLSLHIKGMVVQLLPQIKVVLSHLLATFGSGLGSLIMFMLSLVIAGVFMAASEPIEKVVTQVFERSAGEHGSQWANMLSNIIRSVLVGVIGVAFIQSLIISAALFTFHIPAAV